MHSEVVILLMRTILTTVSLYNALVVIRSRSSRKIPGCNGTTFWTECLGKLTQAHNMSFKLMARL